MSRLYEGTEYGDGTIVLRPLRQAGGCGAAVLVVIVGLILGWNQVKSWMQRGQHEDLQKAITTAKEHLDDATIILIALSETDPDASERLVTASKQHRKKAEIMLPVHGRGGHYVSYFRISDVSVAELPPPRILATKWSEGDASADRSSTYYAVFSEPDAAGKLKRWMADNGYQGWKSPCPGWLVKPGSRVQVSIYFRTNKTASHIFSAVGYPDSKDGALTKDSVTVISDSPYFRNTAEFEALKTLGQ